MLFPTYPRQPAQMLSAFSPETQSRSRIHPKQLFMTRYLNLTQILSGIQ